MSILSWIGKDKVVNLDKELPFRVLKPVKELSVGENSENLLIEGDNLEALKALMPFYYGKVKCIYIDPPYNTGNEGWIYNDKVNSPQIQAWLNKVVGPEGEDLSRHDKWLCMMFPRLQLLKNLMADNGAIFVSIDDHEHHSLRFLMDEIFGPTNFIASLPRRTKSAGKTTATIASNHDHVLIYAKNVDLIKFKAHAIDDKAYKHKDEYFKERGPFALTQTLDYDSLSYSPSLDYELVLEGNKYYPGTDKNLFLLRKAGSHRASDWTWRWSKDLVEFGYKEGFLVLKKGKNGKSRIYTKTYFKVAIEKKDGSYAIVPIDRTKNLSTLDLMDSIYSNDVAKKDLRNIFGASAEFAYPKPVSLVKYLLNSIAGTENAIILDSFAGSGTTGQAVLELNMSDQGNRKFILVEVENEIAKRITAKRLKKVTEGYEGGIFPKGTGQGFKYLNLNGELYNQSGFVNLNAHYEDMAAYIYFTETKNFLDITSINNPHIGSQGSTHYFLFFEGKAKNILDEKTLKQTRGYDGKKIIYADKCLIDDEQLEKLSITFKQIPYELKKY